MDVLLPTNSGDDGVDGDGSREVDCAAGVPDLLLSWQLQIASEAFFKLNNMYYVTKLISNHLNTTRSYLPAGYTLVVLDTHRGECHTPLIMSVLSFTSTSHIKGGPKMATGSNYFKKL